MQAVDLQKPKCKNTSKITFLLRVDLKTADARIWQRQYCNISQDIRDTKPEQEPDTWGTGMALVGIDAAYRRTDDEEEESPESHDTDQRIVGDAEHALSNEKSPVEEQNAQFEGRVGDFFDDEGCLVDLVVHQYVD